MKATFVCSAIILCDICTWSPVLSALMEADLCILLEELHSVYNEFPCQVKNFHWYKKLPELLHLHSKWCVGTIEGTSQLHLYSIRFLTDTRLMTQVKEG